MRRRTAYLSLGKQENYTFSELTTPEAFELFLTEKKAKNLSQDTIAIYRYHCGVYISYLGKEADFPTFLTCDRNHYNRFILHLQSLNKKDVSIASITRSIRTWFYWLMDNNALSHDPDCFPCRKNAFKQRQQKALTDFMMICRLES